MLGELVVGNKFEKGLLKYFTIESLKKIRSVKIGIAGAGGLGSNCAMNLVRCGFNDFIIIDFDKIDESNLNRQFYFTEQIGMFKTEALKQNLKNINPDVKIETYCTRLKKGEFKKYFITCDIIVEAFDSVESKKNLIDELSTTGKLVVAASGIAGYGNTDNIKIKKLGKKLFIVGDFVSEVSKELPPLSPGVMIAASKQADVILKYVLDELPD